MGPHPRIKPPRILPSLRILAFTPASPREEWILRDLAQLDALVQVARSASHVVAALVEDPPPRPAVLVVDFDHMHAGEMLQLHAVRDHGWCGVIVALGVIPMPLRSSLGIEHVVGPDSTRGALAKAIGRVGFHDQTIRIPVRRDVISVRGG